MFRPLGWCICVLGLAVFSGLTLRDALRADDAAKDPADGNLVLVLPESSSPPSWAPDRVSKLTVEGVDFSTPRGTKRQLKVKPKEGKNSVTVVFSFWPNTYTNLIRSKVVKLDGDKAVTADLTKEDPDNPDKVKPIFFPTPYAVVDEMCKMGKVGKDDVVMDIGSGDGRMVIVGVKKFGAKKGIGIEIENYLVKKSNENAKKEGVTDKVEFRERDATTIKDFSEASVVLLYAGGFLNDKLKPVLRKTLKPGTRIVSHRFGFGDDWKPDETKKIRVKNNYDEDEDYELLLWTIK